MVFNDLYYARGRHFVWSAAFALHTFQLDNGHFSLWCSGADWVGNVLLAADAQCHFQIDTNNGIAGLLNCLLPKMETHQSSASLVL